MNMIIFIVQKKSCILVQLYVVKNQCILSNVIIIILNLLNSRFTGRNLSYKIGYKFIERSGDEYLKKSLTKKIIVAIVLLVLICSSCFTYISYQMIHKAVTNQMKSDGITLISFIKTQIEKNKADTLEDIQLIFSDIKKEGNENIVYVSLSDENANLLVSDDFIQSDHEEVDGMSSATTKGDVVEVINQSTVKGDIITLPSGEEVYNVSIQISFNKELNGALNLD